MQPGEYEEGSSFCVVLYNICLEKWDTITREMDLAIDPKTGNRRDTATVRELPVSGISC